MEKKIKNTAQICSGHWKDLPLWVWNIDGLSLLIIQADILTPSWETGRGKEFVSGEKNNKPYPEIYSSVFLDNASFHMIASPHPNISPVKLLIHNIQKRLCIQVI